MGNLTLFGMLTAEVPVWQFLLLTALALYAAPRAPSKADGARGADKTSPCEAAAGAIAPSGQQDQQQQEDEEDDEDDEAVDYLVKNNYGLLDGNFKV